MPPAPYERLLLWLSRLTDYEREARAPYDRTHFDLARMDRLCERLGRPERTYRVAHVAGTKGKGSTSTFLASCLRAAGRRVGLYTSPHLCHLGERIAVGGRAASEADLGATFEAIEPVLEAMREAGERFTFFEVLTALAFERFRAEGVEVAVVEVGLGGRLDSTNVVRPEVCVITSIGLDHTDKLGTTCAAIAREKAGILKPGVPAVVGRLPPEAAVVIHEVARERGAPLFSAPADLGAEIVSVTESGTIAHIRTPNRFLHEVRLRLLGRHMAENAALAAAAVEILGPISGEAIRAGLAEAWIGARFQVLRGAPTVVVDGAHNPDAIAALEATLRDVYPAVRPVVVFGALRDKDVAGMIAGIARFATALVAAPCGSPRETPPEEIGRMAAAAGLWTEVAPSATAALMAARRRAGEGGLVLVCGSLYLAGAILGALGAIP